jgi:hypothetical protein
MVQNQAILSHRQNVDASTEQMIISRKELCTLPLCVRLGQQTQDHQQCITFLW